MYIDMRHVKQRIQITIINIILKYSQALSPIFCKSIQDYANLSPTGVHVGNSQVWRCHTPNRNKNILNWENKTPAASDQPFR